MKNWKDVPIPRLMRDLPKDKRGYPVPYIVARDKQGAPQFRINDGRRVEDCLDACLCSVCGRFMPPGNIWFVGGPLSAFHEKGVYADIPVHKQCAHYSLQVCPYMAIGNYQKTTDVSKLDPAQFEGVLGFQDLDMTSDRVPFFAAVSVAGFDILRTGRKLRSLRPWRPYLEVEFWKDGSQISMEEAYALFDVSLIKQTT